MRTPGLTRPSPSQSPTTGWSVLVPNVITLGALSGRCTGTSPPRAAGRRPPRPRVRRGSCRPPARRRSCGGQGAAEDELHRRRRTARSRRGRCAPRSAGAAPVALPVSPTVPSRVALVERLADRHRDRAQVRVDRGLAARVLDPHLVAVAAVPVRLGRRSPRRAPRRPPGRPRRRRGSSRWPCCSGCGWRGWCRSTPGRTGTASGSRSPARRTRGQRRRARPRRPRPLVSRARLSVVPMASHLVGQGDDLGSHRNTTRAQSPQKRSTVTALRRVCHESTCV